MMKKSKKQVWLFMVVVFTIPLAIYATISWYESRIQRLPILIPKDENALAFNLKDQYDHTITTADWDDKIVVANLFFSYCPVICPKMINNIKKAQEFFIDDSRILFCSFSVDPTRDSVNRLRHYANIFKIKEPNWHLLTGDKTEIYRLARQGLKVVATDGDGGPTDFIHSDRLILFDEQKRIRGYYEGTSEKDMNRLIKDIKRLKNEA